MTTGLFIFTLLWVVSCWILHRMSVKRLERLDRLNNEATRRLMEAEQIQAKAYQLLSESTQIHQQANERLERLGAMTKPSNN